MTHKIAEDFIKQADLEITRGNLHGAWEIAVEALKHFPDHAELQKYEYILAPPNFFTPQRHKGHKDMPSVFSVSLWCKNVKHIIFPQLF